jgi:hypothetical protein
MSHFHDSLTNEIPFDPWGLDELDIADLLDEPMDDVEEYSLRDDPLSHRPNDSDIAVNGADPVIDPNALIYPIPHLDLRPKPLISHARQPRALLGADGIRDDSLRLLSHDARTWPIDSFGSSTPPVAFAYQPPNLNFIQAAVDSSWPNTVPVADRLHNGSLPLLPHSTQEWPAYTYGSSTLPVAFKAPSLEPDLAQDIADSRGANQFLKGPSLDSMGEPDAGMSWFIKPLPDAEYAPNIPQQTLGMTPNLPENFVHLYAPRSTSNGASNYASTPLLTGLFEHPFGDSRIPPTRGSDFLDHSAAPIIYNSTNGGSNYDIAMSDFSGFLPDVSGTSRVSTSDLGFHNESAAPKTHDPSQPFEQNALDVLHEFPLAGSQAPLEIIPKVPLIFIDPSLFAPNTEGATVFAQPPAPHGLDSRQKGFGFTETGASHSRQLVCRSFPHPNRETSLSTATSMLLDDMPHDSDPSTESAGVHVTTADIGVILSQATQDQARRSALDVTEAERSSNITGSFFFSCSILIKVETWSSQAKYRTSGVR